MNRIRKTIIHLFFASFILSLVSVANANEEYLEEGLESLLFMEIPSVITSTLTKQNPIIAPSSITVFTEQQIESMGLRDLGDLLGKVPGITISKTHFGEELITLRGIKPFLGNDKFKFMINGHAAFGLLVRNFEDKFQYSLENVKQVEIIRGPGSSLFGTGAFAGVINIITKSPEDIDGYHSDVKIESFDTVRADLTAGRAHEDWSWTFNFNYFDTDGDDPILERDALAGTPISLSPGKLDQGYERIKTELMVQYKEFTFEFFYLDNDVNPPVPQASNLTQRGETKLWEHWYFNGKHEHEFSDNVKLTTTLFYDYMDYVINTQAFPNGFSPGLDTNGDGIIEFFPEGDFTSVGHKGETYGIQSVLDYSFDNNKLLLGVAIEKVEMMDTFFKSNGHPVFLFNVGQVFDFSETANFNEDAERDVLGLFFQDQWRVSEEVSFIIGGRYDDYDDFGSTFNPRVGIVWDFNQKGGVFKILYGSAFKAPTFSQLRNQNNPILVGNRDLDAEELDSIEFNLSYIFAEKLHTNITLFQVETENLIRPGVISGTTVLEYQNIGEEEAQGVEFDFKYYFQEKNYFYGSYSFTDAEDQDTGLQVALIPEITAKLGLNLHFWERWNWDINLEHIGEIEREVGDVRDDLDASTVLDTTVRVENIGGFVIYFSVYNLTDEDYFSATPLGDNTSDLQRPGINYSLGATLKF